MNSYTDDEDEVRLPSRGSERRTAPQHEPQGNGAEDREFTLSTGTVLGIFFALALVCAVFFGFGYTMGRKSGQATAEANTPAPTATSEVAAAKPSPSAPAIQAIPGYLSQSEADAANRTSATQTYKAPPSSSAATTVVLPTTGAVTTTVAKPSRPVIAPPTEAVLSPAPKPTVTAEKKPSAANSITPVAATAGAGANYVQIAAVSHQEDADVLLSALKRRGYAVFTRPGETDKLIHVQVGPFASKKDADAMRQRLLGDGYNAIVK